MSNVQAEDKCLCRLPCGPFNLRYPLGYICKQCIMLKKSKQSTAHSQHKEQKNT